MLPRGGFHAFCRQWLLTSGPRRIPYRSTDAAPIAGESERSILGAMDNETDRNALERGSREPSANERRGFRILIAYDTPVNAMEAMRLADGMVGQLGEGFAIHRDLWRFDILTLPEIRDDAVRETLDADLVVVAADAERSLPAPVMEWLAAWAARGVPSGAILVTLLNVLRAMPVQAAELRCFLRGFADEAGLELFTREFTKSSGEGKVVSSSLQQRAQRVSGGFPDNQRYQ